MAEFVFPERRFIEAGATQEEVDQLRREFNASDVTVQRDQTQFWASQSARGLLDFIIRLRTDGRFGTYVASVDDASPQAAERALDRAESASERESVHDDAQSAAESAESESDDESDDED